MLTRQLTLVIILFIGASNHPVSLKPKNSKLHLFCIDLVAKIMNPKYLEQSCKDMLILTTHIWYLDPRIFTTKPSMEQFSTCIMHINCWSMQNNWNNENVKLPAHRDRHKSLQLKIYASFFHFVTTQHDVARS